MGRIGKAGDWLRQMEEQQVLWWVGTEVTIISVGLWCSLTARGDECVGEYTHSPLAHLQAKAVSNPGLTHSAEETETVRESVFFHLKILAEQFQGRERWAGGCTDDGSQGSWAAAARALTRHLSSNRTGTSRVTAVKIGFCCLFFFYKFRKTDK